jgi:hypothetical protein
MQASGVWHPYIDAVLQIAGILHEKKAREQIPRGSEAKIPPANHQHRLRICLPKPVFLPLPDDHGDEKKRLEGTPRERSLDLIQVHQQDENASDEQYWKDSLANPFHSL